MQFAFDLISDLHIETWSNFDWTGQATSPFCVVAGDISRDRKIVYNTLKHLGSCYQAVFYIDGNDEHMDYLEDIGTSYSHLSAMIETIPNVVYMHENVVVIDGVAILATNGWWLYDFDSRIDVMSSFHWWKDKFQVPDTIAHVPLKMAATDAAYMVNSINKLQTHSDVRKIVCVTHTVPDPVLIDHDIDLQGTYRFNCMGNSHMSEVWNADTENKIHTWCFGHYHSKVDRTLDSVRYVNNCRGRGDTRYSQFAYYPLRITVDI